MNNESRKVESTKYLIERDDLIIPSELEEKIAKLVASHIIKDNGYAVDNLKSSTYDIELSKVLINLQKYFDETIVKLYYDNVINGSIIKKCLPPQTYITSFRGPQIPWDLNIPYELDELSHIYIGHEAMHVFTNNHNEQEWKYLLLYSDVIPMLYELIQAEDQNQKTKKNIINFRLASMVKMYNNVCNKEIIEKFLEDKENLKYYQMPEKQYFISFYYTILLYMMYKQDAREILNKVTDVLNQKITTEEMLKQVGIKNDIKEKSFEEGYKLILK